MSSRHHYPQRADSSNAGVRSGASVPRVSQTSLANSVSTRESRQHAGVSYPQAERPGSAAPTLSASKPTTTGQLGSVGSAPHPITTKASNDQPARTVNPQDEGFRSSCAPKSAAEVRSSPLGKTGNQQAEGPSPPKPTTSAAAPVANGQYTKRETKPAEDSSRSAPPPPAGSTAKSATARQIADHHEADRPGTSSAHSPAMNPTASPQLGRIRNVQAEGPRGHTTPAYVAAITEWNETSIPFSAVRSATNGQHTTTGHSHSQDLHGSILSSATEPDATGQSARPSHMQAEAAEGLITSASAAKPVGTAQLAGTESKQAGAPSGSTAPPSAAIPVKIKDNIPLAGTTEGGAAGPSGAFSIPCPDGKTKVEKAGDAVQLPQADDVNVDDVATDFRGGEESQTELIRKEEVEKEGSVQLTLKTLTFAKLWSKGLGRRNIIEPLPFKAGELELKENDVIIAVTGTLGEKGKRLFVDAVVGDNPATSHNFDSHDGRVHYTAFAHPQDSDRNVVLAYAMLNDEKLADSLRVISTLLAQSSLAEKNLSGIIYLEDIANSRTSKSSQKDHKTLEKYLRGSAKINVIFATTGWDKVKKETEQQREKDVRERWKAFVQRGAGIIRFDGSSESAQAESAQAIVGPLISTADDTATDRPRKVYKGKESKVDDIFMVDPRSTDIVIPIMGPTGVGKSTFINTVAGKAVAVVGHNLKSQTAHLQHVVLPYPKDRNRRIILVDTPGFDDTYVSDSEILRRIAVWLAKSYSANMKLSGVVYMHEISQTRMLGTSLKNLEMFQKLCGDEGMKNVILATTKWSEVPEDVGQRREQQLMGRHWKPMLELGSELRRFTDTQQSGWEIIDHILKNVNAEEATDSVAIQQELVEIDKILPETDAGQMLRYTLEELLESQKQTTAQLRNDEGNPELRSMLEENKKKISATVQQLRALNIPFTRRLKSFFLGSE